MGSTNLARLNEFILAYPSKLIVPKHVNASFIVAANAQRSNIAERLARLQIGKIATILRSRRARHSADQSVRRWHVWQWAQ
jgi:hypothetical protein